MENAHDIDNLQLKLAENHFLAKAFAENSMVDLQQFAVLRRARGRIIGDALMAEMQLETTLGLAEYARLMVLIQANRAEFVGATVVHMSTMRNPQKLLDARKMAIATGCVLCLALKQIGIDFDPVANGDKPLFWQVDFGKTAVELLLQC